MKHQLKVNVSKKTKGEGVMRFRRVSIREKILNLVLGKKREMVVFMPSDKIQEVVIKKKKGGEVDE